MKDLESEEIGVGRVEELFWGRRGEIEREITVWREEAEGRLVGIFEAEGEDEERKTVGRENPYDAIVKVSTSS